MKSRVKWDFQEKLEMSNGRAYWVGEESTSFYYFYLISGNTIVDSCYFSSLEELENHYTEYLIDDLMDL